MSARTFRRLLNLICVALMISVIVQLIGGYDFRGLPFLFTAIAAAALLLAAIVTNRRRKPVEKPE